MTRDPATGRPRSGLRWRLALYLAVLTAVSFAITARIFTTLLERKLEAAANR